MESPFGTYSQMVREERDKKDESDVVRELYTHTFKGEWGEVVKLYETKPEEVWSAEITSSGDTALHMVINEYNEDVVAKLVHIIDNADKRYDREKVEALTKANDIRDTPLHRAAARGSVGMCRCIVDAAKKYMGVEDLIGITNEWDENPIFVAVLDNRKHAFIFLLQAADKSEHKLLQSSISGDTILHSAIRREHYGIRVDPLEYDDFIPERTVQIGSSEIEHPKNYRTCYQFFSSLRCADEMTGVGDPENHYKHHVKGNVPQNYATWFQFLFMILHNLFGVIGYGEAFDEIIKARRKHTWSAQILDEMMKNPAIAYMTKGGSDPGGGSGPSGSFENLRDLHLSPGALPYSVKKTTQDTALLVAAQKGVEEIVNKILERLPVSIHDTSSNKKNIVLVAVENRQPRILKALSKQLKEELEKPQLWQDLIRAVDADDNTILHLAAKYDDSKSHPWQIHGSAMQMQWEVKWYEHVKSFLPPHFVFLTNKKGKTPVQIFTEDHKDLVKNSSEWLKDTSESCSVMAALVAGVSFATSNQVPGGTDDNTGKPKLEGQPALELFAVTALIGLCFSVTALVMFLSILTSRKQHRDFKRNLPMKLLLGLSSLFVAIASMLISFCAAHFFMLEDKFKKGVFPLYAATCLPLSFYAIAQFPLYTALLKAIVRNVPQSYHYGHL